MRTKDLIQLLVGTKEMVVEGLSMEAATNAIVIKARPTKREQCWCGICHRRSKYYDCGRGVRRWRCSDLGTAMIYVEAPAPREVCKEHGVVTAAVREKPRIQRRNRQHRLRTFVMSFSRTQKTSKNSISEKHNQAIAMFLRLQN